MPNSKIYFGKIKIRNIKFGKKDVKLFFGKHKNYPTSVSIADADVTCNSAIYNGNNQTATNIVVVLSGVTLTEGVDYTVTKNNGGTNVGSYDVEVTGTGEDYEDTARGTFTINKVTPTVTAPKPTTYIYDGTEKDLVSGGSTNWGTLQYSTTSGGTYSTTIPKGTNATSYDVWYRVLGNSNINDVAPVKVSCSIAKADPTYTAPTAKNDLVYNKSSQALLNGGSATGGIIQYSSDNTNWSTSIPSGTNAGDYTSYWRIVGDSNHNNKNSASLVTTISKVTPTVTAPTAKSGLVYNGNAQALVNAGSTNYGTLKYSTDGTNYSTSVPSGTNATSYTVYYKVDGDSNINNVAAKSVQVSISKVTPTVTAPTAKSGLVYNGNAQALATAGSTNWGTLQYSLDDSTYSTSIPSGTNATSYTIYYKVVGNSNINNVTAKTISASIAKADPTYTAPTANNRTYDTTSKALLNAGSVTGGTMQYSSNNSSWSTTIPSGTTAGSYTSYWRIVGDSNHNDKESVSITTTISKASCYINTKPTSKTITYNGSAQALVNAGSNASGTILYKLGSSGTYGASVPSATTAGTYTVYYKVSASDNYDEGCEGSVSCSIAKKAITCTAPTAKSLTYNGSAQALANAGSVVGGSMTYATASTATYGSSIPSGTNAGDYTVYWKGEATNANYSGSCNGSLGVNIAKADTTYTAPTANNRTYDTTSKALLNAGSVTGGTMQYSSNNSSWDTTIPSGTTAGSYTSYWRIVGDSNHNDKASASISTTISAKTVSSPTITLSQSTYTYNGSACKPTVTVKDGSTTIASSEYTVSYSNNTNVGTATVTITDKSGGNYTVSGSKTFTINKVTPTVTAPTPKTLTFNNANQVLANAGSTNWGTIQYCLNNSGGTYSTTVPSASAANTTYKVWYKVVGDSNINDVAPASIDCMIAEKRVTTPTIVLDPTSYTYNGSACQPTVTVKDGSTVIPASEYTKTFSNNTNAGTATVTISDNTAGNYYISGTTTFTINKASGSVSTKPTAKSLTYNGSAQSLVNAGSGTGKMLYVLSGSTSWSETIPTGTNATSYTVCYKASASTNYNESASGSVAVTISAVTPTVTAPKACGLTYNGNAQNLVSGGSTNYGTLVYSTTSGGTYSTTIPQGTNATSYTVWYKVSGNTNINSTSPTSVSITIAKANPTYTAPTANNRTYDTTSKALLNAGSTSHGTIQYSSNNSSWSTTIPSGTNAGEYTSYWKLVGDSNHKNISSTSITTTISAKTVSSPTITLSPASYTYNGSAQSATTVTVKDGSTTIASSEYTVSYSNNTNAGTATCTITDKSGGNYTVSGSKTFTISCYSATAPTAKSLTYNGSAQALVNAGSTSYGTMVYCSTSGGTFSTTIPTGTNAGSYEVWWKVSGNTNVCNTAATKVACTISPKTVSSPTITLSQSTYTYSNSACKPTPTVKDGSTTIASSEYTVSYSNNTNVGTATCTITDKSGGNYTVSGSKTFTINCYTATAPTAKSLTYSRSAQALVNAGSTSYGTMVYCSTSGGTFSTSIPTGTNAGSYEVWWKVSGNTNVCNTAATKVACTIGKCTPVLSTSPTKVSNWTYNATAHNLLSGGAMKHSSSDSTAVAGTFTYDQGTNVGTYSNPKWYFTPTNTTNYNSTQGTITATITCSCYNATAPKATTYTYANTARNLVSGGSTSYGTMVYSTSSAGTFSTTIPTGTNAGSYEVWWKVTGNTNVCNTAATKVACSISCASCTAPTAKSLTWTGSAQALVNAGSVSYGTMVYCSTSGGTFSTSIPTGTNAGSYEVWWKVTGNTNVCNTAATKVACSIAKAAMTHTAPKVTTYTYNNTARALVSGGSANGGSIQYCATSGGTYSTTVPTQTNAGSYDTWWKAVPDSNHSGGTSAAKLTTTISCYTATGPTNKKPTYTGSAIAYANAGSTSYGTMVYCSTSGGTFTTSIPTGTNAGSYECWWKVTGNTNVCNTAATKVACSIAKAAMTYTAPKATTYTYGNTARNAASGGSANGGSIQYCTTSGGTYSTTIPTNTNVGTYDCWWKAVPDSNHSGGTSAAKITATINCYSATGPTNKNPTYTGSAIAYANAGSTSYGTMVYCSTSGGTFSTSIPTGTNAGSYECWWKVTGNTNVCNTAATKVACSIAKAAMTYTAPKAASRDYTGSAQQIVSGQTAAGGSIYYATSSAGASSSTTVPTQTNVGTYSTYWKAIPDSNHSGGTSSWAQITGCAIKQVAMTYTAPKVTTYTYNNTARALVSGGSANGGSIQYCTTSGGTYSTTVPTQTNAGSYDTWWKAVPDSNHSGGTSAAKLTTTINCKACTAPTAKNPNWSGSAQALVNAGSTSYGTMVYCSTSGGTFTTSIPTGTNAGSYTVYWKVTGNTNVCCTASSSVSCSIKKVAMTYTAPTAKTGLSYTGSALALMTAGAATGGSIQFSTSQTGTYSTTIPTQTNAGTYTTWWKAVPDSNHSGGTDAASASTTIAKVAMTYTAPSAATRTYNASAQQIVSGQSAGGGSIYYATSSAGASSSTTVPTQTAAGTYTTYWKAVPDSNHSGGTSSWATISNCKINAKTVSSPTITLSPTGYTYSGSACKPTPTVKDGSTTIASSEYTVSYSNNTNAGTATCTITDKSGGNYTVSGSKTFTIAKASINCSAPTAKSLTWTGSAQALANAGSITGGTMYYTTGTTYAISMPTGNNAGSYTLSYSGTPDSNHSGSCSGTVACSIAKKTGCTVSFATTSLTKTYGDAAFTNPVTNNGDSTVTWSPTSNIYIDVNSSGKVTINSGGGTTTVKATVANTSNCTYSTTAATYSLTLNKASQSAPTATGATATCPNCATGSASGGGGHGDLIWDSYSENCSVGTISTRAKWGGDSQYNESSWSNSVNLTVSKAPGSVTTAPTPNNHNYAPGTSIALCTTGSGTGTMLYKLGSGSWSTSRPTAIDAGDYTVYYKASASTCNEESASRSITCTIYKIPATVTTAPVPTDYTWNGNSQNLMTAGVANGGTMVYKHASSNSWSTTIPTASEPTESDQCFHYKVSGDSNHTDSVTGSVYCHQNWYYPTPPTPNVFSYNGSGHVMMGAGYTSYGRIIYSNSSSSAGTYGTNIVSYASPGQYTFWWKVSGSTSTSIRGVYGYSGGTMTTPQKIICAILPDGMKKVEYLQSQTGGTTSVNYPMYIDTGIVPTAYHGIYVVASSGTTYTGTDDAYIVGCRNNSSNTRWCVGNTQWGFYWGYASYGDSKTLSAKYAIGELYLNYKNDKKYKLVNANSTSQYKEGDLPSFSFAPQYDIRLFGSKGYSGSTSSPWHIFIGKIYHVTITYYDEVVMDLYPVVDYGNTLGTDTTPAMYDRITNTYFTNNGRGSFAFGSIINN